MEILILMIFYWMLKESMAFYNEDSDYFMNNLNEEKQMELHMVNDTDWVNQNS